MGRLFKNSRKESVGKITIENVLNNQISLKSSGLNLNIKNEY